MPPTQKSRRARCTRCDRTVREVVCRACIEDEDEDEDEGEDEDAQAEFSHEDLSKGLSNLYSNLCKSAAIVAAILPRQGTESNEQYIQRLLKEADMAEAREKKAVGQESASATQSPKNTNPASSTPASSEPEEEQYEGDAYLDEALMDQALMDQALGAELGHGPFMDSDLTFFDQEGNPYDPYREAGLQDPVYAEDLNDPEYEEEVYDEGQEEDSYDSTYHEQEDDNQDAGGIEEETYAAECPQCYWLVKKDRCMRCNYLLGDEIDPGNMEEYETEQDAINAAFEQLLHGRR
ncbi:hypothetical protein PMZ80_009360 [Knufia obscura]|uniref:Uncharacterized protein n=1 Tax=Knufia obscura TaxID=1635080 RepID=A0ABR0RDS7_9EURO|nr:hypothetical protein PMZ80_009360 [Knufia obscura]